MATLEGLGMEPVLALLHHGSGPRGTSFLDPDFPRTFAAYARGVAEAYPWVTTYLPINEPTTTARFAGLYGFWEPHGRSSRAFAEILLAQCRAIRAAVREIRAVNPAARFIVNEDVGVVRSTPRLEHQARFDTERRWAAVDLLSGRLVAGHRLWAYLVAALGSDAPLLDFVDDPCPPDVIGLDYYVTSDRFLDHRVAAYPRWTHGGNGVQRYADVELVRIEGEEIAGWDGIIAEASSRYGLPLALTEVSLAGDPVDACAWWLEAWEAATSAAARGVRVEAVTAWAAFGARGWEQMLVEPEGVYAPGLFDVSATPPAPTLLGDVVRAAAHGAASPPLRPGWWRQPERTLYAA